MKAYTIQRASRAGERYETMVIRNRETGEEIGEYRLTLGEERREIAGMRRALDRHLEEPNGTRGNYQW